MDAPTRGDGVDSRTKGDPDVAKSAEALEALVRTSRSLRSLRLFARSSPPYVAGQRRDHREIDQLAWDRDRLNHSHAVGRGLARNRSLREVFLPLGDFSLSHNLLPTGPEGLAIHAVREALERNPTVTRLVPCGSYYRPMEYYDSKHSDRHVEDVLWNVKRNVALREVAVEVARVAARGEAIRAVVDAMSPVGFTHRIMRYFFLPPPCGFPFDVSRLRARQLSRRDVAKKAASVAFEKA